MGARYNFELAVEEAIAEARKVNADRDLRLAPNKVYYTTFLTNPLGVGHKHIATIHCDGRVTMENVT